MGGNVFRDGDGHSLTKRIEQTDIKPTLFWLEQMLPVDLQNNTIGTTGLKPTSGDIDVAVDTSQISKEDLYHELVAWASSHKLKPIDWVKKSGNNVHFKTPIAGDPKNGYVQTDFMLTENLPFTRWFLSAPANSEYKGSHRNIFLNSIGKAVGLKVNQNIGLVKRSNNEPVPNGNDPDTIAKLLLNKKATRDDLYSVETIMQALADDPKREEKIKDFREFMAKEGIPFLESRGESDVNFLARLRDRIVNQGMRPLVEGNDLNEPMPYGLNAPMPPQTDAINSFKDDSFGRPVRPMMEPVQQTSPTGYPVQEEEAQVSGGRAKGIEHLEDLVFRRGTAGIKDAIHTIEHLGHSTEDSTTVKWDGSPALIFGREPDGAFVLTDVSGFGATGYDGMFKNIKQLATILHKRDSEAKEKGRSATRVATLLPIYQKLWPMLEAATPKKFRGYVQGDLLYTSTPPEEKGEYVFTPNTITYRIPASTELGKRIGSSEVGIAMHTMFSERGAQKNPIGHLKFHKVDGLFLIDPVRPSENVKPSEREKLKILKTVSKKYGQAIDTLFNPAELRTLQITDLPKLCIDYVNSIVKNPEIDDFSADHMLGEFAQWLQQKVSPRKLANIVEYLQSPSSNTDALSAAFTVFVLLHEIKMDILQQLDRQHPGQEGWVIATPRTTTKLVNRFDFSRNNLTKAK